MARFCLNQGDWTRRRGQAEEPSLVAYVCQLAVDWVIGRNIRLDGISDTFVTHFIGQSNWCHATTKLVQFLSVAGSSTRTMGSRSYDFSVGKRLCASKVICTSRPHYNVWERDSPCLTWATRNGDCSLFSSSANIMVSTSARDPRGISVSVPPTVKGIICDSVSRRFVASLRSTVV